MIGKYRFYKNGQLVSETKNIITNNGKVLILRYLAGELPTVGGAIAVGAGDAAALATDLSLGFEFGRSPVVLKVVDVTGLDVTFKSRLDSSIGGVIYEVGLFPALENPNANGFGSRVLASFEASNETWSNGTSNITNFRLGEESLQLSTGTNITSTNKTIFDLTGYSNTDEFAFAYYKNDAFLSNIKIRFKVDAGNYFEYSFTPSGTGYKIQRFTKTDFTSTGSPSWTNINLIDIIVTASGGTTTVQLDGLIIIDKDVYDLYAMVSRSVLLTPMVKEIGEQIDIEYVLESNI